MTILALLALTILALAAVGWRLRSKRTLMPCPAEFAWLVEMENPLARATNSNHVVQELHCRPARASWISAAARVG